MTARNPFFFALGALLIAALACSLIPGVGGDDAAAPASTSAVFEEGGESEAGSDGGAAPTTTEAVASGGSGEGATCLTGLWEVDDDSYLAWLRAILSSVSITELTMEGDLFLSFDGDETYTLNGPLLVTGCNADGCIDASITYEGSGAYSVVDGNLVLSEGPTVTTDLGAFGAPASATVWAVDAPYNCSGDTLTFAVNEFPSFVWNRVE